MLTIKKSGIAIAILVAVMTIGCGPESTEKAGTLAPAPPPAAEPGQIRRYDYSHKVIANSKRRMGQYWTVAILRFGDTRQIEDAPFGTEEQKKDTDSGKVNVKVNVVGQQINAAKPTQDPPMMNKRAREILKNSLVNSDAFVLVERERILEILREINFGKTKYVAPETTQDEGQLYCVRYLIEGSLGPNEDKTLKDTLDAKEDYRDAPNSAPGALNIFNKNKITRQNRALQLQQIRQRRLQRQAQRKFSVACYLSAYEVRTGQVKVSVMGLGTNGLEAINDAVEELIEELTDKDDGLRVAAVNENTVYLDIGSKGGIKVGETFQVVSLGKEIRNRHGLVIGYKETEAGEIEVTEVKELMSIAKVLRKAHEIKRGDLVKPAKH